MLPRISPWRIQIYFWYDQWIIKKPGGIIDEILISGVGELGYGRGNSTMGWWATFTHNK